MEFVSRLAHGHPVLVGLTAAYATAVFGIVVFIWARRITRSRYFSRRDARAYELRRDWPRIVSGEISPEKWRNNPLDREIVETMLFDSIDAANEEQLPVLVNFLRLSGLLDVRLHEARWSEGWRQRGALVALGRTRAKEAIAPLVDALNSTSIDIRTAATRGLGAIGLVEAAVPILERIATEELDVPAAAVSTALVQCCGTAPRKLMRYFHITSGTAREMLARVLAEVDVGTLGEELISLARDESAEVRACAARGLPKLHPSIALPVLSDLLQDTSWFVRLRAVVSLGSMELPDTVEPLVRMLRDSNRLVRQRAAAALVRRSDHLRSIIRDAVALHDSYGLQALLSELDRCGACDPIVQGLRSDPQLSDAIDAAKENLRLNKVGDTVTK